MKERNDAVGWIWRERYGISVGWMQLQPTMVNVILLVLLHPCVINTSYHSRRSPYSNWTLHDGSEPIEMLLSLAWKVWTGAIHRDLMALLHGMQMHNASMPQLE